LQFLRDKFLDKSYSYITESRSSCGKELQSDWNEKSGLQDLRRQVEGCTSNAQLRQRSLNFNFLRHYLEMRLYGVDLFGEKDQRALATKSKNLGKLLENLVVNYCEVVPEFFVYVVSFMMGYSQYLDLTFVQCNKFVNCLNQLNLTHKVKPVILSERFDYGEFSKSASVFLYSKLKTAKIDLDVL